MRLLIAFLALLLAGCLQPRSAPLAWAVAGRDRVPRQVVVVKVWDALRERIEGHERDGRISHYVELDVLKPGEPPEPATWPYDEQSTGRAPPTAGDQLVVSPADFLLPTSHLLRRAPR
jgi:hypothetical protein